MAPIVALSLIPMIGIAALAIDGGMLMAEQRRAQAAADSASFAAVCTYHQVALANDGRDPMTEAAAAARTYAKHNGFLDDGQGISVQTSRSMDSYARYPGADPAIQVVVTSHPRRAFSAIWSSEPLKVVGSAVSLRVVDAQASPAIILLNQSAASSLSVVGSARVIASEGEIQVKSNHAKAVDVNNAGRIESATLKIGGGYQINSGGSIASTIKSSSDPSAIVDPQASLLSPPNSAGLPARQSPSGWNAQKPFPIYPGIYNNGLTLNSGGMAYTMAPGVYYIKQGNFTVSNGVPVRGEGVTIYLDNGNIDIQGGYGGFFGDSNTVYLTPPTAGPYKDVSFYQRADKNASTGDYTSRTINMANGTYNKIDGLIYAPGANTVIAGGSTNRYGKQLIVNKLNVSNNALVETPKVTNSAKSYSFRLAK